MKKIVGIITLFLIALNCQLLNCQKLHAQPQHKLNFGLPSKQPMSELPKSKTAFIPSVPKTYQYIDGKLQKDVEGKFTISEGWEMTEAYKLFEEGNSL